MEAVSWLWPRKRQAYFLAVALTVGALDDDVDVEVDLLAGAA